MHDDAGGLSVRLGFIQGGNESMRMKILLVLGALGLATGASAANLVSNGGFEANGGVGQLAGGISYATDWTVGATLDGAPDPLLFIADGDADFTGFPWISGPPNFKFWGPNSGINNGFHGSGSNYLAGYGGFGPAPIVQSIAGLTVGNSYRLSFDFAMAQITDANGAVSGEWDIAFGSDLASTGTISLPSMGFVDWSGFTYDFTATAATQDLKFTPASQPGLGGFLLLDNVSLDDVTPPPPPAAAVPEPSSWAMMIGGLGLAGAVMRRRARVAVAA
jgi:hypothetical protein